jgi:hypothetical protein
VFGCRAFSFDTNRMEAGKLQIIKVCRLCSTENTPAHTIYSYSKRVPSRLSIPCCVERDAGVKGSKMQLLQKPSVLESIGLVVPATAAVH